MPIEIGPIPATGYNREKYKSSSEISSIVEILHHHHGAPSGPHSGRPRTRGCSTSTVNPPRGPAPGRAETCQSTPISSIKLSHACRNLTPAYGLLGRGRLGGTVCPRRNPNK